MILYDLKIMDDEKHSLLTGASNEDILKNLRKLILAGKDISIRIPLISEINDDEKNITEIAEFLVSIGKIKKINLLPYHDGGSEKRKRLRKNKANQEFKAPSPRRINKIKKILSDSGFSVSIGG
jgi:pyruvate formate lyase activating enzyme